MTAQKGSRNCLYNEDCESTVTMSIKCRRGQLTAILPILALFSLTLNVFLVIHHSSGLADDFANELDWGDNETDFDLVPDADSDGARSKSRAEVLRAKRQQERRRASTNRDRRRREKENPVVTPRAESLMPNATFSACLLIKDDNDILDEWIAYHYHSINMRQLVVAVDPLSTEFPSKILEKWRLMTDLEVMEWTDAMYMSKEFVEEGHPPEEYMQKPEDFPDMTEQALLEISNHRYRQRVFLAQCMKTLRHKGHSWMIHIDSDEYVVASKLLRQMKPDYLDIESLEKPGAALHLLQQAVSKTATLVSYPCISMLRVLFGSVESKPEDMNRDVPPGFNGTTFETMRWRYHALPHNMSLHGNPKVIVDVAAIPEHAFPNDLVYSIHRPVEAYCQKNKALAFTNFRKQPIAVNHYLGSWERYSGRNDKRRSREVYNAKANVNRGQDDGVKPWLKGFVQTFGAKTAAKLLDRELLNLPPLESNLTAVAS